MGLLQFLDFKDEPGGFVKFRYKLLKQDEKVKPTQPATQAATSREPSVTGRVLDKPDGKGVADVSVGLWSSGNGESQTTRTDKDGRYIFHNVKPSNYAVSVNGLSVGSWTDALMVTVAGKDVTVRANDLCLTLPQSLSGTVRDVDTGKPVPGVEINFSTATQNRASIITDAKGKFRLYVIPRKVSLDCTVFTGRYYPLTPAQEILIPMGRHIKCPDFKVSSAPPFSGRVLLPDGKPAADISVGVMVSWPKGFEQEIQEAKKRRKSRIDAGKEPKQKKTRAPGRLIIFSDSDYGGLKEYRFKTDKQGRFRGYLRRPGYIDYDRISAIHIFAVAQLADYSMAGMAVVKTTTIDPPPDPFDIKLARTGSATFKVINPDGEPISNANFRSRSGPPNYFMNLPIPGQVEPRFENLGNGQYRATRLTPDWRYWFRAGGKGYRGGSLEVTAKSGINVNAGTLKPRWWGKKVVPELIQQLHNRDKYNIRERACRLLGSLKAVAAPAVPDLIELVKNDPHITVRFEAAAALGQIGPSAKPAVPDLIRALQNDKHGVPREAAKALGLIGEPSAVGALKAALGHQEIAVRRAALESLKGEPFRGLAPAIAPLLEIGQSHVVIVHHELMILALRALREDGAVRVAILIETPVSEQLRGEWPFLVKLLTGQRLKTPEQLLTWWWRFPMPPPAIKTAHLDAKQLKALWDELGDEESLKAYRATQTMASGGDQTLAFLAERFKPVSANPKRIKAMITELDDDEYAVRHKAFEELSRIGRAAEAALRAALKGELSAEARPRVSELLEACSRPYPVLPEAMRVARGIRVLELIGTPEAVKLLKTLATGSSKAHVTEQAKAALHRIRTAATQPGKSERIDR